MKRNKLLTSIVIILAFVSIGTFAESVTTTLTPSTIPSESVNIGVNNSNDSSNQNTTKIGYKLSETKIILDKTNNNIKFSNFNTATGTIKDSSNNSSSLSLILKLIYSRDSSFSSDSSVKWYSLDKESSIFSINSNDTMYVTAEIFYIIDNPENLINSGIFTITTAYTKKQQEITVKNSGSKNDVMRDGSFFVGPISSYYIVEDSSLNILINKVFSDSGLTFFNGSIHRYYSLKMQPLLANPDSSTAFDVYLYITTENTFQLKNQYDSTVAYNLYLNRENDSLNKITSSNNTFLIKGISNSNYINNIIYLSVECYNNTQIDAGDYTDEIYINFITSDYNTVTATNTIVFN